MLLTLCVLGDVDLYKWKLKQTETVLKQTSAGPFIMAGRVADWPGEFKLLDSGSKLLRSDGVCAPAYATVG